MNDNTQGPILSDNEVIMARKLRDLEEKISYLNENKYRKISSLISNIAYSCIKNEKEFHFDWITGSVEKILGYTTEEMYSKGCWRSIILEEDLPVFEKNITNLKPGEKSDCELRIKSRDGSIRWINSVAECNESSEDPNKLVIHGAIIDKTGAKNAEQALNHSHDLMRYVIEHNRGAVAIHDKEMRYIYVSQRYLTDYMVKEKDIIGKHHYDVFPDLPEKWKFAHKEALKGKISRKEDDIYEKEDGTAEWTRWECRPWYEADGSIGGIIVYTEVITERKKFELALKASEFQLNAMFNSAPVVMILINERTEVLKVNKFGLEATGRNIESLTGLKPGDLMKCINSFIHPEGCGMSPACKQCTLRNKIKESFTTGKEHYKFETVLITQDDAGVYKNHTILISTSVISTIPEKQVLITIDDISDRKELEKELIKARDKAEESDNLKSAFLSNISHEIRTPMNGIMGFSEMLTKPNISEEKRHQFSSLIQDGCRQLLGVINDVIEISMLDSDQVRITMTEFNLNELMQDIYLQHRSPARAKNISLRFNTVDCKIKILTDREKLKHICSNLVSNAIKFTDLGETEFGYSIREEEIEFYISDTGIGIKKELHEAIFDRFRQAETTDTRSYGGTGLGLSIAKGLINLLGGRIWLKSEPGKGTTFYFSIPATIIHKESGLPYHDLLEITKKQSPEILVAEDDEINFLFMQEVMHDINVYPVHAKNGSEALHLFKKYSTVKLILMDIKMPVMDGYEATRCIREIDPGIPIIAQTAYAMPSEIKELNRSGFNGIISKPIDKEKLESIIKQYLR